MKYFKCDEFMMMVKSMLKHFSFIKPSLGLYDGKKLDVFIKITGEEKVYIHRERLITIQ